jgi:diaminopimelate decarboxylase
MGKDERRKTKDEKSMIETPYYLIDESLVEKNLKILAEVKEKTGCKILLAQKAFSCFYFYPLMGKYLDGTTSSGPYEARLGKSKMGKENHTFSPAFQEHEFNDVLNILTILFLIPLTSLKNLAILPKKQVRK